MGGFLPPPAAAAAAAPLYAVQFFAVGAAIHLSQVSDPGIIVADFTYLGVGSYSYTPNAGFAPNGILWAMVYSANNGTPMYIDTGGGAFGTGGAGQGSFNIQTFDKTGAPSDAGTQQLIFQLK